ncbi:hypothetical protein VP01_3294g1 [Puccinia sorghi]|uniref:Uncharacterized protein n=1 Tax=Puccinia sorghi TaxID=27349 RepID=A0A0L6UXL3_9BASI|nr:hypothetical protein VP01_3294g1 [Puccinia sorghi]
MAFGCKELNCVLKRDPQSRQNLLSRHVKMKTLDCVRSSWFALKLGFISHGIHSQDNHENQAFAGSSMMYNENNRFFIPPWIKSCIGMGNPVALSQEQNPIMLILLHGESPILRVIGAATFVPGHSSPQLPSMRIRPIYAPPPTTSFSYICLYRLPSKLLRSYNPPKHLRMKLIFCALISYATIFGVSGQTYNFKARNFVCKQSPYLSGWCGRHLSGSSISLEPYPILFSLNTLSSSSFRFPVDMAPAGDVSSSFNCSSLLTSMNYCCSPGVVRILSVSVLLRCKSSHCYSNLIPYNRKKAKFLHLLSLCEDMPKKLSQVSSAEEGLTAKQPTLAGEESTFFSIFLISCSSSFLSNFSSSFLIFVYQLKGPLMCPTFFVVSNCIFSPLFLP